MKTFEPACVSGSTATFNEPPQCPLCGGTAADLYLPRCRDILCGCPGEWSLMECRECGLVYTFPPLTEDEAGRFYPDDYIPYNPGEPLRSHWLGRLVRHAVMIPYRLRYGSPDWGEVPFGTGRMLDVGCGAGNLLKHMHSLGWDCSGLDFSRIALERARQNVPQAHLYQTTLEHFATEHQDFDLITMSHVLEHLPNPLAALKDCYRLLRPGGRLIIGVPNLGSFESRLFGRFWIGLDIPRHLVHFREPVLRQLLEQAGFSLIRTRPAMFASSISESLTALLPESVRIRFLRSRWPRVLYLSLIFPAALSYLLGNRGMLEVVAQKPTEP